MLLPALNRCLLIWPLKYGCFITLAWTAARTLTSFVLILNAIPDIFLFGKLAFMDYAMSRIDLDNSIQPKALYTIYVCLLLGEVVLFVYTCHNLGMAMFKNVSKPMLPYLVCRVVVWFIEMFFLFLLCLVHPRLIGWYLIFFMIVVLESYGSVVVYSYYRLLREYEIARRCKHIDELFERQRFDCPFCADL